MSITTPTARPAEASHRRIRELEALIERLRLIISAQARIIGRLYARLPDDGGDP